MKKSPLANFSRLAKLQIAGRAARQKTEANETRSFIRFAFLIV
jgi:hypothetical protein